MASNTSPTNTGKINFNISAPGKIILHGEHSVVYNKLALAASLDLRTHANLTEINNTNEQQQQQIQINFTNLNYNCNFQINNIMQLLLTTPIPILEQYRMEDYDYTKPEILDHSKLLEIIKEFLKNHQKLIANNKIEISLLSLFYLIYGIFVGFKLEMIPFSLTISTDLSIGAGTGSSASYLVTLTATLINYIKLKQPPPKYNNNHKLSGGDKKFNNFELDLISRWAYCAEKIIHGTPSGIDNTICTYGSMIEFRKQNTKIDIVKFKKQLPLLLINTKIQRNTRLLVEKVANLYKNHSNTVAKIFETMDALAQEAAIYLKQITNDQDQDADIDDCYNKLMELSSINHNLLRSLNVSHPKLDAICQILQQHQLEGKLTGAGGGGYAICLIPPKFNQQQIQQIIDKLKSIDCDTIYTNLGGEGVQID